MMEKLIKKYQFKYINLMITYEQHIIQFGLEDKYNNLLVDIINKVNDNDPASDMFKTLAKK